MAENQNADGMSQQEAVKANWEAIIEDHSEVIVKDSPNQQSQESSESDSNAEKTETSPGSQEEKKETTDEGQSKSEENQQEGEKTEQKTDESQEEDLVLDAKDITDAPPLFEDGTFRALAHELGADIKEESFEAFREAFVPKSELEKVRAEHVDSLFSQLKPETAAALKLIEQGIPEEQVFAPTKEIDSYLAMEDIELVRKDLELTDGWTKDLIDAKLEQLANDPNALKVAAGELRIALNQQKNAITQQRTQLLQEYEARKAHAEAQRVEQTRTQFINELNNVSEFMGHKLTKAAKEAVLAKYINGMYENEVNAAKSMVNAILYKEFGDRLAKNLQSKAAEEAKSETRKKLLNVPPVKGGAGQRSSTDAQSQNDNNWGALLEDFKD